MTKMMRSVVSDGTAARLNSKYNVSTNIAGKTGTTQSQADGWFMCFTPNIVCGAWVGGMTPAVKFRDMSSGQGAASALPICGLFLQKLYKTPQFAAMKDEKFPELSKWVKDSMNCDPHIFAEGELERLNSELDTVGVQYPVDFMNEKPTTPQDDPNDLREKPSGTSSANNMPPEKTITPPAPKVELKPQPNYKPASTKPVPTPTTIPVAPKTAPPPPPSVKQSKTNIGN
jgi:membrane carboxypeptidase/penicillin-binding protein